MAALTSNDHRDCLYPWPEAGCLGMACTGAGHDFTVDDPDGACASRFPVPALQHRLSHLPSGSVPMFEPFGLAAGWCSERFRTLQNGVAGRRKNASDRLRRGKGFFRRRIRQ
jgi:hypothetical protein